MSAPIIRHFADHAFCVTEYIPAERWLRTTWQGFVVPTDAKQGAAGALEALGQTPVPYLLNDNSQIQGLWFDSVDWLQRVWAAQAAQLGLRYVAHVLQPHTEADLEQLLTNKPFANSFELQLFTTADEAAAWLRECQRRDAQHQGTDRAAAV